MDTNDFTLFVQCSIGHGFGVKTNRPRFQYEYGFSNGVYGQLQFGTTFSSRAKYNILVAINLDTQKLRGELSGLDWNTNLPFVSDFDLSLIRPGISVGFIF